MAQGFTWIVVALCVAVIASDLYARRVPNVALLVTLCLGSMFLPSRAAAGLHDWPAALAGLGIGLLLFFPIYLRGWMGAGDVKLIATLGFLFGPIGLLHIWLLSVLILLLHVGIGLFASRLYLWAGAVGPQLGGSGPCLRLATAGQALRSHLQTRRGGRQGAPYAAHLCLATLILLAGGWLA